MAKAKLHPNFYEAKVTCASCNHSFETMSTLKELKVDICSNCHPFYTSDQRSYAQDSRVEKFRKKYKLK